MADNLTYTYDVISPINERWPKLGDKLVSPGYDAFLALESAERRYRLQKGYKRAGDILIQRALEECHNKNNLVFPALFNYQHYIELALKAIIERHGYRADVSPSRNHDLSQLWRQFLRVVEAFGLDPSEIVIASVGACVAEFASIDAGSTAFRYVQDLSSDAYGGKGINLVHLHDTMNGIENFFECSDLEFTHQADIAEEEFVTSVNG